MLYVFFFSLLFLGMFAGFGRLAGAALNIVPETFWLYPWLGFFALSTYAIGYALFFPLNWLPLGGLAVGSAWGMVFLWKDYQTQAEKIDPIQLRISFLIIFGLAFVYACVLAYGTWPTYAYDTDLYHANAITWLKEYGIVPGLGNLHSRLAMNSSWLAVAALLDTLLGNGKIAWIMPSLGYMGYLLYLFHCGFFEQSNVLKLYALLLLFFPILLLLKNRGVFPSLYYDGPCLFLIAIAIGECLRLTFVPDEKFISQSRLLVCLMAAAYMVKSSAAFSVVMVMLFIGGTAFGRRLFTLRTGVRVLWPAGIAAGIWLSGNGILSGYPLFPLPRFSLASDWAMLHTEVQATYDTIVGWARAPGMGFMEAAHGWDWLQPWFARHLRPSFFIVLWGPLVLGLAAWTLVLRKHPGNLYGFFFLWCGGNTLFWFLTAPDMRFGKGFFEIFFALGCAFYLVNTYAQYHWQCSQKKMFLVCVTLMLCFLGIGLEKMRSSKRTLLTVEGIPSRAVPVYALSGNAENGKAIWLYKPSASTDDRCGNSPVPCTPFEAPSLRLRVEGDVGKGFYSSQ